MQSYPMKSLKCSQGGKKSKSSNNAMELNHAQSVMRGESTNIETQQLHR